MDQSEFRSRPGLHPPSHRHRYRCRRCHLHPLGHLHHHPLQTLHRCIDSDSAPETNVETTKIPPPANYPDPADQLADSLHSPTNQILFRNHSSTHHHQNPKNPDHHLGLSPPALHPHSYRQAHLHLLSCRHQHRCLCWYLHQLVHHGRYQCPNTDRHYLHQSLRRSLRHRRCQSHHSLCRVSRCVLDKNHPPAPLPRPPHSSPLSAASPHSRHRFPRNLHLLHRSDHRHHYLRHR